jgi:two-component system, chemotaxis family, chemotaxis protein CheY
VNILVLEDSETIRELIKIQLNLLNLNAKVFEAESVDQAIKLFDENKINYILSDWDVIGDKTGLDFLKIVRRKHSKDSLPFILVSVKDEVIRILNAVEEGASDYIVKPWTAEEFKFKFETALGENDQSPDHKVKGMHESTREISVPKELLTNFNTSVVGHISQEKVEEYTKLSKQQDSLDFQNELKAREKIQRRENKIKDRIEHESDEQYLVPNKCTILVIEDDPTQRSLLLKQLKEMKMSGSIFEASDLAEAKKFLGTGTIQYILSDWNLPDGEGIELLKLIRKHPKLKHIVFVMVTDNGHVKSLLKAIEAGANEFIIKPWSPEEFSEKFHSAWPKKG